jgi:cytochrome c-type biogenesis protein CcmH
MDFMSDMSSRISFAVLVGLVTLLLYFFAVRSQAGGARNAAADVYRAQLDEISNDVKQNRLSAVEAEALRAEIARRLLSEVNRSGASASNAGPNRLQALLAALLVPIIAIPIYLHFGAPKKADAPLQSRIEQGVANNDIAALVLKVEQHLQSAPDDAKGWQILAPIYAEMGRFADAANAYERVLRLEQPSALLYANLGEMLVSANKGIVPAEAMTAFREALKLEPNHPKARFFLALGLKQEGKIAQARVMLEQMLATAPLSAPWRKDVERELGNLAKAPALTEEQMAAGSDQSSADQQAVIRSMVDGLDARLGQDGSDVNGWLRLIRARMVLGETAVAETAVQRAKSALQGNASALASISALERELGLQ